MKTTYKFVVLFLALLSIASCSDKEDTDPEDDCGAKDKWHSASPLPPTANSLLQSDRYLYYEDPNTPNDICGENLVTAEFKVIPENNTELTQLTSIQGKIYWGLSDENYVTLTWKETQYVGTVSANIKDFFGEAPGWVGLSLIYKLPTNGSLEQDLNFIDGNVNHMYVDLDYSHY